MAGISSTSSKVRPFFSTLSWYINKHPLFFYIETFEKIPFAILKKERLKNPYLPSARSFASQDPSLRMTAVHSLYHIIYNQVFLSIIVKLKYLVNRFLDFAFSAGRRFPRPPSMVSIIIPKKYCEMSQLRSIIS
jgi:hypothetical protein